MKLEKAENGYILSDYNLVQSVKVFATLEEALNEILFIFEGRLKGLGAGGYGEVIIMREDSRKQKVMF